MPAQHHQTIIVMRTFSNKFNALTTKQKMRAGFAVVLVLARFNVSPETGT